MPTVSHISGCAPNDPRLPSGGRGRGPVRRMPVA